MRPKRLANKYEPSEVEYTGGSAVHELESWVKQN